MCKGSILRVEIEGELIIAPGGHRNISCLPLPKESSPAGDSVPPFGRHSFTNPSFQITISVGLGSIPWESVMNALQTRN